MIFQVYSDNFTVSFQSLDVYHIVISDKVGTEPSFPFSFFHEKES